MAPRVQCDQTERDPLTTLSRLVLGTELASVLTKLESRAIFKYRLFQIGAEDKYRVVVHLESFEGSWSSFDLPEPKELT